MSIFECMDKVLKSKIKNKSIVLFDGVCNLCNSSVSFVIKRDSKNNFVFASLQSDFGKQLLQSFNQDIENLSSLCLIQKGKLYKKSSAALKISSKLKGLWKGFYVLMLVPKFIRDWVYGIIAKNRYQWFGKQDACMIPDPSLKAKFIA